MSTTKKSTKSKKSVKSVKSRTAAKAVKKSTKSTKSKPKKSKRACGCDSSSSCTTEYGKPYKNNEGRWEYPALLDGEEDYGVIENEVPPRLNYYYATNHVTGKKFIISGYELSFSMAKIVAEQTTGDADAADESDVYIIKVGGAIAWLFTKLFKVETIDADDVLNESANLL